MMLLNSIPVVNIIMLILTIRNYDYPERQRWAKGALILLLIRIIVIAVMVLVLMMIPASVIYNIFAQIFK